MKRRPLFNEKRAESDASAFQRRCAYATVNQEALSVTRVWSSGAREEVRQLFHPQQFAHTNSLLGLF